jgi:hypothetical protein
VDSLSFYATQSLTTDPGHMAYLYDNLPTDLASLRRIARGLVVHYQADDLKEIGIPDERVEEINTRYADKMLQRLIDLDDRPLTAERPQDKAIVGCCRDYTVLLLSMLRHNSIPARGRVGFGDYFVPGWCLDHEVAEVWDAKENRWRLVDANLDEGCVDRNNGAILDGLDLPRDHFLTGGEAWHLCRAGEADPERFVVDPDLAIPVTRGWTQLRHNLVQDLAALNKREMLLWDTWGMLGDGGSSDGELALLDHVADVTRQPNPSFADVQSLYCDEAGLRVPDVVTSFNLISGSPERVTVEA